MVGSTVEAKRALRRELLARRRALTSEEHARVSLAVVHALATLPELTRARTLLLYAAQPDEVDVSALPAALAAARTEAGVLAPPTLLLPRVVGTALELARAGGDGHDLLRGLRPGAFGLLEPPEGARIVDAEAVDLAIVPGVAFSPAGRRLGRGGGFYDRLLTRLRPDCIVVGVCAQVCTAPTLPEEPHDRPVDVVVTDASLWRRAATDAATPT
jgi:5-formyltetrahydrofolate cyclo-ligase